ncbi:MAG: hypothetical protein NTW54_12065 [Bacteroidetes bacterium]|nr:hypothetical protein [Bacteroidota bacterium]
MPPPPQIRVDQNYNPFNTERQGSHEANFREQSNQKNWQELYTSSQEHHSPTESPNTQASLGQSMQQEEEDGQKQFMQIHKRYIVTSIKSGIMLIDQQAAHERILYERYLEEMEKNSGVSQQVLFPVVLQFSASDLVLFQELRNEFKALGFILDDFGNNQIVINGLPAEVNESPQLLLESMLEQYKTYKTDVKITSRESVARSLSKRLSIPHGKTLDPMEMRNMIDELFACTMPYHTADGKVIVRTISMDELERIS